MQPLVVEYLRCHTFRELENEHGVCVRPNVSFDKFSLNYDTILSRSGEQLSGECRGMVVRPDSQKTKEFLRDEEKRLRSGVPYVQAAWRDRVVGNVEVLAWPMNRFYNHGDVHAAPIDWSDPGLRVLEKLDGTCCILYWDPLYSRWFVATRSVSEADLPIRSGDIQLDEMTFSDLFFQALVQTREANSGKKCDWDPDWIDKVVHLNKELTYVFELTSPINRVVVKYDEPRVTLLAARHTASGREIDVDELRIQHVNRPMTWSIKEPTAVAAFVESSDPSKLEGVVVIDSQFNRRKIKSRAWVLSSKAKDLVTVSRRSALESIINGTIDDVIPLVEKDVAAQLELMREQCRTLFAKMDRNFVEWKAEVGDSRKFFAEKVMLSGDWTPAYFALWEGKVTSVSEWSESMAKRGKLSSSTLDIILEKMAKASNT